jgi:hypothetical protein
METPMSSVRYIAAANIGALRVALSQLPSGETGYIDAEGYKEITGEDLDEFSTEGRRMIAEMAAVVGCTIDCNNGRVHFLKK